MSALRLELAQVRAERATSPPASSTQPAPAESQEPPAVSVNTSAPASPGGEAPLAKDGPKEGAPRLVESILPGVKLSGPVLLFSYTPLELAGARPFFDLNGAHLNIDRAGERVGVHFEPRFRTSRFRPYFEGTSWVQEAYVSVKVPEGAVKVGRVYKQLGIFSDFSFFGDLPYFDGLKYNAEWGASYEGKHALTRRVSLQSYAQFFRVDGRTNGSFQGRDVVSDPNGRRRNAVVLRGVPTFALSDRVTLAVGGSFERGDVTRQLARDDDTYRRVAGEARISSGGGTLFGEIIRQTFEGTPLPDLRRATYSAIGGNYDFKAFAVHFNYSQGRYETAGVSKEYIVQPGVVVPFGPGLSFYTEYDYWVRRDAGTDVRALADRSLNLVLIFSIDRCLRQFVARRDYRSGGFTMGSSSLFPHCSHAG